MIGVGLLSHGAERTGLGELWGIGLPRPIGERRGLPASTHSAMNRFRHIDVSGPEQCLAPLHPQGRGGENDSMRKIHSKMYGRHICALSALSALGCLAASSIASADMTFYVENSTTNIPDKDIYIWFDTTWGWPGSSPTPAQQGIPITQLTPVSPTDDGIGGTYSFTCSSASGSRLYLSTNKPMMGGIPSQSDFAQGSPDTYTPFTMLEFDSSNGWNVDLSYVDSYSFPISAHIQQGHDDISSLPFVGSDADVVTSLEDATSSAPSGQWIIRKNKRFIRCVSPNVYFPATGLAPYDTWTNPWPKFYDYIQAHKSDMNTPVMKWDVQCDGVFSGELLLYEDSSVPGNMVLEVMNNGQSVKKISDDHNSVLLDTFLYTGGQGVDLSIKLANMALVYGFVGSTADLDSKDLSSNIGCPNWTIPGCASDDVKWANCTAAPSPIDLYNKVSPGSGSTTVNNLVLSGTNPPLDGDKLRWIIAQGADLQPSNTYYSTYSNAIMGTIQSGCCDAVNDTWVGYNAGYTHQSADVWNSMKVDMVSQSPQQCGQGTEPSSCIDRILLKVMPNQTYTAGPADINGDEIVNVLDLLEVLDDWGASLEGDQYLSDVNTDLAVDVTDLMAVIDDWGRQS